MPLIRAWRNDYNIWKWCRQNDFISDFEQARWFENQAKDPTIRMYKIVLAGTTAEGKPSIVPVGVCGFTSIDMVNRRAEFSLYTAPAYQHQGLGMQALRLLLTHGFRNLNFHLIWGEVFEGNPALEKFLELGFKREGTRQDFYFRDGQFIDAILITMKAKNWK